MKTDAIRNELSSQLPWKQPVLRKREQEPHKPGKWSPLAHAPSQHTCWERTNAPAQPCTTALGRGQRAPHQVRAGELWGLPPPVLAEKANSWP